MLSVLSAAKKVIGKEKTILSLQGEFEAVGDIHGDLQSLATIFEQRGLPNFTKYVFLGDYVDRGDFSIEVVLVLFSFQITAKEVTVRSFYLFCNLINALLPEDLKAKKQKTIN